MSAPRFVSIALPLVSAFLVVPAALAQRKPTSSPTVDELQLDAAIDWIRDPEQFIDARRPKRNLTEKIDRSALLGQALAKAKELGRPVLWHVYRVIEKSSRGRQMYRAPVLDVYMRQVLFNDPVVTGLINQRFVPLRMVCDEAMAERFGLRPLEFIEPGVVFLSPDGELLHVTERLRTFSPTWFADLLRRVLRTAGEPAEPRQDLDLEQLIESGYWELALARLRGLDQPSAEDRYRLATVQRRLGQYEDGLKTLASIETKNKALQADIATERGAGLVAAGKFREAAKILEGPLRGAGARRAEAGYLLAHCALADGGDEARALRLFQRVANEAPDSSFGRRAQANLSLGNDERPMGAAFSSFETLQAVPLAPAGALPRDTVWSGPTRSSRAIAIDGVRALLNAQRDHGGFEDCRYAYWGSPRITPNAWTAITALCASALVEWRDKVSPEIDRVRIDDAIQRAERYLFDPRRIRRGQNEDVYADAYRLAYLYRCTKDPAASADRLAALRARMTQVIREARQRQKESGFWAHEYNNAFCTAVMMWGLLRARDGGAEVPDEMLSQGALALASARSEDGSYVYGGSVKSRGRPSSRKDAAVRMPHCESVLLALGRSDPTKLDDAFSNYWQHMDRIERVRRNDFHSDGELAGFFYFHGLYHNSEAAQLLEGDRQVEAKRKLLQILQSVAEIDGTYVDSHEIGRSYGTAMALLTLRNVVD